jgi:hypothetical protein
VTPSATAAALPVDQLAEGSRRQSNSLDAMFAAMQPNHAATMKGIEDEMKSIA